MTSDDPDRTATARHRRENPDKKPTADYEPETLASLVGVVESTEKRIEVLLEGILVDKIDALSEKVDREFAERRAARDELITQMRNFVLEVRGQVSLARGDVASLRTEVRELRERLDSEESRATALRDEVDGLRCRLTEIETLLEGTGE